MTPLETGGEQAVSGGSGPGASGGARVVGVASVPAAEAAASAAANAAAAGAGGEASTPPPSVLSGDGRLTREAEAVATVALSSGEGMPTIPLWRERRRERR